jgi:hypothetical protein
MGSEPIRERLHLPPKGIRRPWQEKTCEACGRDGMSHMVCVYCGYDAHLGSRAPSPMQECEALLGPVVFNRWAHQGGSVEGMLI